MRTDVLIAFAGPVPYLAKVDIMPAFCRSPATPVTLVGERPSSALEIPGSAPGRAPRAHAFACSHLQVRACARRCRRPSAGLGKELINLISSPRKTGNSSAIANPLECNDRRIAGNLDDDVIERDLDIERLAAPKLPSLPIMPVSIGPSARTR